MRHARCSLARHRRWLSLSDTARSSQPLSSRCIEIESWLAIFGGSPSPGLIPKALWLVNAEMRPLSATVAAYVLPIALEILRIEAGLVTDPQFKTLFDSLDKEEKRDFYESLTFARDQSGVEY
jgi:hypothetical protein